MSEWATLATFEDWANKLDELLEAAREKLAQSEPATDVQRRLRQFRLNSPFGPRFDKLNDIAFAAVTDIAAQTTAQAIERIALRSNELDDAVLQLRTTTSTAQRDAAIINLRTPTTIVTSLTETVGALKDLRDGFTPDTNQEQVNKRIATAITAITKLRDTIESVT